MIGTDVTFIDPNWTSKEQIENNKDNNLISISAWLAGQRVIRMN